ncbi:MAG: hydroxymyristoyl-ACP dehydratase [Cyclobacteriaceae bacterium]|nr:hydroxymyristoyl-ACP dehydratase [Cyclobacteriaceae bacterium]
MLKNDLYTVSSLSHEEDKIVAEIEIDSAHDIFKGHFPDQPVLPGVCTIEILKEIISDVKGKTYKLREAHNIKFLSLVDPTKTSKLFFKVDYSEERAELKINASASLEDDTITFKVKGVLV